MQILRELNNPSTLTRVVIKVPNHMGIIIIRTHSKLLISLSQIDA